MTLCPAGQHPSRARRSGVGKTTLMDLLAGFEHPTSGSISWNGIAFHDDMPWERPVTSVFQSYNLFAHLTCHQNVSIGLTDNAVDARQIDEAFIRLGIDGLQARLPSAISAASNNVLPLPALFCATNRSCYWMKASAHWTGIPAPAVSMLSCLYVKTVAWPCCLSAMMIVTRTIWGVMCCRLIEQPLSSFTDLFYPHVKGRCESRKPPPSHMTPQSSASFSKKDTRARGSRRLPPAIPEMRYPLLSLKGT